MAFVVADTDVLIDFLRDRGAAAQVAHEIKRARLRATVLSVFELWSGAYTPAEKGAVENLLIALPILALEPPAARHAAEIKQSLESNNLNIGMADALIASICLLHSCQLLTRNTRHFSRINGLQLYLAS